MQDEEYDEVSHSGAATYETGLWWDGTPLVAAVQLRRVKNGGADALSLGLSDRGHGCAVIIGSYSPEWMPSRLVSLDVSAEDWALWTAQVENHRGRYVVIDPMGSGSFVSGRRWTRARATKRAAEMTSPTATVCDSLPAWANGVELIPTADLNLRDTITQGQLHNCQARRDVLPGVTLRYWVSRQTVEDGATCCDEVTVERSTLGEVTDLFTYCGRTLKKVTA